MINAQEWLNNQFSTPQEKNRVKKLVLYSPLTSPFNLRTGEGNYNLKTALQENVKGELDFSTFSNLERLEIYNHFGRTTSTSRQGAFQVANLKLTNCRQLTYLLLKNTCWSGEDLPDFNESQAELDLSSNTALTNLTIEGFWQLRKLNLGVPANLVELRIIGCPGLYQEELDLSNCFKLNSLWIRDASVKCWTWVERLKQEIKELKQEIERLESEVWGGGDSDSEETLNAKIQRKKQELAQVRDTTRQPTKYLRKEIELLEKIQALETQIIALQNRETNYQQQIQQKEEQIQAKQSQIANLQSQLNAKTTAEQQARTKIAQLEGQITNLQAEKQALQERMLAERQQALAEWEQEKAQLQAQIAQLNEQKDTFQKSADYLRSTLKDAEKARDEAQTELKDSQEKAEQTATNHQATLAQKDQELAKKQENYKLIQERNTELQAKLTAAQEEVGKLTEWISKLEAASVEGDAFQTLQGELVQSKQTIQDLEEQLSAKQPRKNYLWLYVLIALVAVYFLMS